MVREYYHKAFIKPEDAKSQLEHMDTGRLRSTTIFQTRKNFVFEDNDPGTTWLAVEDTIYGFDDSGYRDAVGYGTDWEYLDYLKSLPFPVGEGENPQAAYEDLNEKLRKFYQYIIDNGALEIPQWVRDSGYQTYEERAANSVYIPEFVWKSKREADHPEHKIVARYEEIAEQLNQRKALQEYGEELKLLLINVEEIVSETEDQAEKIVSMNLAGTIEEALVGFDKLMKLSENTK